MTRRALACLAAAMLVWAGLSAPASATMGASLVRDIAGGDGPQWSSFPHGFHRLGAWTLFIAQTPAAGDELWRTDGTSAGTTLVKDLEPGPFGSMLSCFAERDGAVYFLAHAAKADDLDSDEAVLWRSDGTPRGTVSLARVPGEVRANIPCPIVATAGWVMFAVVHPDGDGHVLDVWRSNGTAAGTDRVARIASPVPSYPTLVAAGRIVFFDAASTAGVELWKSDGTAAGTRMVVDIAPGAASAHPLPVAGVGDTLLFAVPAGGATSTLWRSDGTAAGTMRLVERSFEITAFTPRLVVGDRLLFSSGEGIVSTDGTAVGTVTVVPGTTAAAFANLGGSILFLNARFDGSTLWRWDDLDGAPHPVAELGIFQLQTAVVDDQMLFTIAGGADMIELWRTDGSADGTVRLVAPGLPSLGALGAGAGRAFFGGPANEQDAELWTSDGTSAGTRLVTDLISDHATTASSYPRELVVAGGRLYFTAVNSDLGPQLWTSDGTGAGTSLVREIGREGYLQNLSELTPYRGALFFSVSRPNAIGSTGLWRSDGTPPGTMPAQPSWPDSTVSRLTIAGDHLYFLGASAGLRPGVCRSEGDRDDARCGGSFRAVREMVAFGDRVLLSAAGSDAGVEPWISDGTPEGTALVRNIAVAPGVGSEPSHLQTIGDAAFFVTASDSGGSLLWRTDGSEAGTEAIEEWAAEPGGAPVVQMVASGAHLFLAVAPVEGGSALWVSDGRPGGTELVRRFDPSTDPGGGMVLVPFGNRVLMSVDDGAHGTELWVSDGSGPGTRLLRDLRPGARASSPGFFTGLDNRVAFAARTDLGFEPWVSDGTSAGTVMIADVAPGVASSNPTAFAALNGTIYFSATDLIHGYELWREGAAPACRGDCGGDGRVTIDDLIQAVTIALGVRPAAACASVDAGGDGRVTIDELIAAVGAALEGC